MSEPPATGENDDALRRDGEAVRPASPVQALSFAAAAERRSARGDSHGALLLIQSAVAQAPDEPAIQLALGQTLLRLGRANEALAALDHAIQARCSLPAALYSRGLAHERLGDIAAARKDWEAAAAAAPDWPDPPLALAALEGRVGRPPRARQWAGVVLDLRPGDPIAGLVLAAADVAEGQWAAAESRLSHLLDSPTLPSGRRPMAFSLWADALTGLGRIDEAFAAYEWANALWRDQLATQAEGRRESALDRVRRIHRHFAAAAPSLTAAAAPNLDSPVRTHVFLMGFPRSGTTLLERVLDAHPEVIALEERSTLTQAAEDLMSDAAGLARLQRLSPAAAQAVRAAYWRDVEIGLKGAPHGKVFIDKLPLHTVRLPLIARLFPDARVLFALRDPRDVVLSCFRQRFRINRAMAEFLSLERTALYYDGVMRLAELCLPTCGLGHHVVRYEDVVADFRPTISRALAALDLQWDDTIEDFAARQDASATNTPSAQQVARGLYTSGVGQWRPFAAHLGPVLPILEPWIERFGYARDGDGDSAVRGGVDASHGTF